MLKGLVITPPVLGRISIGKIVIILSVIDCHKTIKLDVVVVAVPKQI